MYIIRFKVFKNIKLLDIYFCFNLNMVIYFKLYLDLWNNIRFYNKKYIIVSFNKELLWMFVFVVILDRVIMVWVVFVKFLG